MEYTNKISKNRLFAIKFTTLALLTGFIYYFQFSTFSILITLTWLLWMYKTYYSYYKLQIPDNLRSHFQYIFDGFKNLRKNKPGVFCGLLSLNFMIIAILAQLIPGYSALFAILFISLLVSTKYDIRIIRENDDSTPLAEVEEFYPQMDEKNLDILKQIGENADDSALYSNVQEASSKSMDESDDDSLIPTSADLPNLDDEMDDDEIEIERVPKINPNEMILTQGVEYKKSHFKSSTSSDSDEDSITSGLDFSSVPHTVVDYAHPLSQSTPAPLLALQANVARNLVDNLIKSASGAIAGATSGPSHHSSQKSKYLAASSDEDDSDFEILDKDDL